MTLAGARFSMTVAKERSGTPGLSPTDGRIWRVEQFV